MQYRNYVLIKYQGETEVEQEFDDIIDDKNYIIIDKEGYAKDIVNKLGDNANENDVYNAVNDEFNDFINSIVEIAVEKINNE